MALSPGFPTDPYAVLDPGIRWFPGEEQLKERAYGMLLPPLVYKIRLGVKAWRDAGYRDVSDTTRALLNHWFRKEHRIQGPDGSLRPFGYFFAQREAVESAIWLYEVEQARDPYALIKYDSSDQVSKSMFKEDWARYVMKLATGAGKTKAMSLLIAWAYFHRRYEAGSDLSANFLLIAPNIIVLDRLKLDFDELKIFRSDPVLPENGYEGRNWRDDFQPTLHVQDQIGVVSDSGNIFLTNIHRVFLTDREPTFEDPDTTDYFLGKRPTGATNESRLDLGAIVRDVPDLIVLNDEAHHIHDESMAWFKNIEDISNQLRLKGSTPPTMSPPLPALAIGEEETRRGTVTESLFVAEIRQFHEYGRPTEASVTEARLADGRTSRVPTLLNEFWTARQRQAHSLHEVSYRACFKPQLPRFFIERLTGPGGAVYDPFMGRGTTVLEAALLGRLALGNDANPLARILVEPRLDPPGIDEVAARLQRICFTGAGERGVGWPGRRPSEVSIRARRGPDRTRPRLHNPHAPAPDSSVGGVPIDDLLVFYHPETLREILALRGYLLAREREGTLDRVDCWIRMVAINRLTGHSPGFFSVYTLPPNQAVTAAAQRKINEDRNQSPPRRDVPGLILKKTRALLKDATSPPWPPSPLRGEGESCMHSTAGKREPGGGAGDERASARARPGPAAGQVRRRGAPGEGWRLHTRPADDTPGIPDACVDLVVTSPPFLDVVDYRTDNWLRCWFGGIDPAGVNLTIVKKPGEWQAAMTRVFRELARVLKPGGHVAFEVGEVRGGRVRLEEAVIPCGLAAGLAPLLVLVNAQRFTKTANCWGVANNAKGTNTNRIAVFRRR